MRAYSYQEFKTQLYVPFPLYILFVQRQELCGRHFLGSAVVYLPHVTSWTFAKSLSPLQPPLKSKLEQKTATRSS